MSHSVVNLWPSRMDAHVVLCLPCIHTSFSTRKTVWCMKTQSSCISQTVHRGPHGFVKNSNQPVHLILKTYQYNFDPLKPHFYIVKWGLHRYTLFLCPRHFQWGWWGANSITAVRTYVRPVRPVCLVHNTNGFHVMSFEKIGVLDWNFIHWYIIIKWRVI